MFITQNVKMLKILDLIEKVKDSDSPVLITGETGTGKEVIANYIQKTSSRADKNYVKIGLAILPKDLIESELFGHEKGSFTSSVAMKKGLFEEADGGTIFLDDIDDTPLNVQSKLLRFLEYKDFYRIGSTVNRKSDVRIIASTKVNLSELSQMGGFREDLFYRLNVININIPPLSERADDIKLLAEHFVNKMQSNDKSHTKFILSKEETKILESNHWQGNVRELKNFIERIYTYKSKGIDITEEFDVLVNHIKKYTPADRCLNCNILYNKTLDEAMHTIEKRMIERAINKSKSNVSRASEILGIKRTTLIDKIKKYGIVY
ncbi:MAG: sigma 54-interacting transcriptional regulator [Ignavibacteria bacterium]